ncbi:hypothetical protein ACIRFH_33815 [Streptomyces sp. NPDC093586]|uniref:hypothetical protein n=1 Tax=Streptomyces sp. NPDC093586 TaxID=3366042 RepID=UPI0037FBFEFF
MKEKLGALLGAALASAAFSTVPAATPAHAEQQYTVQNMGSGRCLYGQANRTVRQGPCDANARWMRVYRHNSSTPQGTLSPMLVHVATGLCLDHNMDQYGSQPYLSRCSAEDYGQLIGMASRGGNRIGISPVDGELQLTGWDTGSVSFVYPNGTPDKQLWATI